MPTGGSHIRYGRTLPDVHAKVTRGYIVRRRIVREVLREHSATTIQQCARTRIARLELLDRIDRRSEKRERCIGDP